MLLKQTVLLLLILSTRLAGEATSPHLIPVETYKIACSPGSPVTKVVGAGSLLGDLISTKSDSFECSPLGVGIRPMRRSIEVAKVEDLPLFQSESSMDVLKKHFVDVQATGISVEVWITPPPYNMTNSEESSDSSTDQWPLNIPALPILTIGMSSENGATSSFDRCGFLGSSLDSSGGYDFQMVMHGPKVSVWSESSTGCRQTNISPSLQGVTSILWSQDSTTMRLYVNGQPAVSDSTAEFHVQLNDWDPTYHLTLFSEYSQTRTRPDGPYWFFPGTVHSVSVYDSALGESDAALAYSSEHARIQQDIYDAINSRLIAIATENVNLEQGRTELGILSLGSKEALPENWIGYVEIMSDPTRGQLLRNDRTRVTRGSLLRLEAAGQQSGISIRYKSENDDYFTLPDRTASGTRLHLPPDSFQFRLVAFDPVTNQLLGASENTTQLIHILNRNHPPTLTAPDSIEQTLPTVGDSRPITYIEGIQLSDPDLNINKVRVDVLAVNGTLMLNQNHKSLAEFCRPFSGHAWQCQGDGLGDQNMTFLAEPDNVGLILSRLEFRPYYRNTNGLVIIRAFDGVSGNCLGASQQNFVLGPDGKPHSSISEGCYGVESTIDLPSQELAEVQTLESKFLGIDTATWILISIVVAAVIVLVATVSLLYQISTKYIIGRGGHHGRRSGQHVSFE